MNYRPKFAKFDLAIVVAIASLTIAAVSPCFHLKYVGYLYPVIVVSVFVSGIQYGRLAILGKHIEVPVSFAEFVREG